MTHLEALKIALEKFDLKYIDEWVSEALIRCKGSSNPRRCIEDFLRAKKAEQEKKKLEEEPIFAPKEDYENKGIKIKL